MAVAFGPTFCFYVLVPKSKLLHRPETQYGFVPKHSLHGGKNIALRAEKPYLAMRSFFSEAVFLLTKYVTARKRRRCKVDIFIWVLAHKKNICLASDKDSMSDTY